MKGQMHHIKDCLRTSSFLFTTHHQPFLMMSKGDPRMFAMLGFSPIDILIIT